LRTLLVAITGVTAFLPQVEAHGFRDHFRVGIEEVLV
jgi:hypothetical protein